MVFDGEELLEFAVTFGKAFTVKLTIAELMPHWFAPITVNTCEVKGTNGVAFTAPPDQV